MTAADRLSDYVKQMTQGARDALTFTEGMEFIEFDEFLADLRTQRAVVMCRMIIGEAASRILSEHSAFAQTHPGIPWRGVRGMRNRIAHGYFDIDLAWCGERCKLSFLCWSSDCQPPNPDGMPCAKPRFRPLGSPERHRVWQPARRSWLVE